MKITIVCRKKSFTNTVMVGVIDVLQIVKLENYAVVRSQLLLKNWLKDSFDDSPLF